mmetsp:Transcript_9172/g.22027  ORF Transcript_9172/g.22027 Transcript_9172/m.22027 type:complete len:108 (+) Transcript_9172:1207-1530(+)
MSGRAVQKSLDGRVSTETQHHYENAAEQNAEFLEAVRDGEEPDAQRHRRELPHGSKVDTPAIPGEERSVGAAGISLGIADGHHAACPRRFRKMSGTMDQAASVFFLR